LRQRRAGEVAVLVVDRLDPGAVHRQQLPAIQVQLTTEQHELAKDRAKRVAVSGTEIGDGLEVGLQVSQQPSLLPSFSDGTESIGKDREFREHRSEPFDQRQQAQQRHCWDQLVEHAVLADSLSIGSFNEVGKSWSSGRALELSTLPQSPIEHCGSQGGNTMRTARRPSHSLVISSTRE
jgi:hypothetical protein